MPAVLKPLRTPLIALVIGLGGVGLAWLWFDGQEPLALGAVAGAIFLGWLVDKGGHALLPNHPVAALWLLEAWMLIPIALATAAAAVVVIVTVELTLPDTTPTETKELVGAVSTGITTFLTAGFISWAEDEKDSTLAEHIQSAFEDKYDRPGTTKKGVHVFKPESSGELWVFAEHHGGVSGWGRPARVKRAEGIAKELREGTSEPSA